MMLSLKELQWLYSVIKHTIEQFAVNKVNANSYDTRESAVLAMQA